MRALLAFACLVNCGLAQVKLPPTESAGLSNGIRLIMAPRKEIPMVTVRLLVRGGGEADPVDKAGLGDLTGELLQRGAGKSDAAAFAQRLDSLGAALAIATDEQGTTIRLEFLAKDIGPSLALLSDAVARPVFAEAEIKKALAESIDAVKSSKDDPGDAIRSYSMAMMFGPKHPYGRVVDEPSLRRISRADILAYHKRHYVGRNMIAVVAGDFEPAAMRKQIESAFGALPAGELYGWVPDLPPPRHEKARLLLIDKPDATQTYFAIMMPGLQRGNPDRAGLRLVNTLFGERFTSMLNEALRVNSGLSYGVSSRIQLDRLPGAITISSYTKNDTTVQAIDLALEVLRRLREKGLDAAMLTSAKKYVKGTFPIQNLETDGQVAAILGDIELFGLNRGEIDDLFSRIDAVTLEKANALAKNYYVDTNLQFCLVGKAADIQKVVAKYAPAMKVIPISGEGYSVPDF
jgi:predicted Zn-dependent peptidase